MGLGTVILVDSKLMAYNASFQRKESIIETLNAIEDAVKYMVDSRIVPKDYEVIMGFDFGKSRFRKELHPYYKGHRTEGHKDKTEEEMKEYNDFQDHYRNHLPLMVSALGVQVLGVEGVEYDDLASIVAYSKAYSGRKIIILSEDHDLLQLTLGLPNVSQFMPKTFKYLDTDDVIKLEKVTNKLEFLVAKTIKGDSGDSIMGLMQCGKVCFEKWFAPRRGSNLDYEGWKKDFTKLAESSKVFYIHKLYTSIGINSFGKLFDFNMALGETMVDQKLLNAEEKKELCNCMTKPLVYNRVAFEAQVRPFIRVLKTDFGDDASIPYYTNLRGGRSE